MRRRLKLRRPRLRPVTTTLPLRVGFIGGIGLARLGGGVDSLAVQPDWVGSLRERTGSNLDLLVVDAAPLGFELDAVAALIEEARSIGARVIGVAATGSPPWARLLDFALELGPVEREENRQRIGRLPIVQPVDPRVVNPIGFRWSSDERLAAVGSVDPERPGWDQALRALEEAAAFWKVDLLDPPGELERLRAYRGVVDHAALHPDVREQAAQIVRLGAGGVPVILKQMSTSLRALLGDGLSAALEQVSLTTLADPGERERASVAIRREALRRHSLDSGWRRVAEAAGIRLPPRPQLSVVLAVNRPTYLEHAIEQLNHQSYQPRELVVVLHGEGFPPGVEAELEHRVEGPLTVVGVSSERSLGDALNAGVDAASGEVVTKMDDDDWYGSDHLWDLMLALDYSGAELVAKGAEFVYMEELDITIRRFTGRSEGANVTTVAGGTLTISKHNLEAVGGWRPVPRAVDRRLIEDVRSAGGAVYRTHGFGYLYRRYGSQTWVKDLDYFLKASDYQWRGLELEYAGVAWPDGVKPGSPPPMPAWDGGTPRPTADRRDQRPIPFSGAPSRPPETLAELRLAVHAGPGHLAGLSGACRVVDAGKDDWRSALESERPHLLLIESSQLRGRELADGVPPVMVEELARASELVEWCESRRVPTALWETSPLAQIVTPISLMEKIRHLFVADAAAEAHLAGELEGRRPMQLPLAAQVIPESVPVFGERRSQVAFVGTWAVSGAGEPSRERFEEILEVAARYGLVIFRSEGEGDHDLPERLAPFAVPARSDREATEALRQCRLAVGFDPRNESRLMAPQVVFDALAAGTVVIAPISPGMTRLFRHAAVIVKRREAADREIQRLLLDREGWSELSRRSRAAILNAHTYPHRVATIASVAGFKLIPGAR